MTAYVYIVECADGTLYSGWTNDLEKRMAAHNAGQGAKYTRAYLAPEREPLEMTVEDGYACVTLPRIKGYSVVVFE